VTNLFILFIYTAKHASERLYFIYFFWLRWRLFCNTLTLRDEKERERASTKETAAQAAAATCSSVSAMICLRGALHFVAFYLPFLLFIIF